MANYELLCEKIESPEQLASDFKSIVEDLKKLNNNEMLSRSTSEIVDQILGLDEKYPEALTVVIEHRSASASLLQRRLGIGYNRAVSLIVQMEERGIVGPAQASGPRKILILNNC